MEKRHRIKFYSRENLATGHNLKQIEELLEQKKSEELSLNDLFEHFNIKLYFDDELFLISWDEKKVKSYVKTVNESFELLKKRLTNISDQNIGSAIGELDSTYSDNFWNLLCSLNSFKSISKSKFKEVISNNPYEIYHVLPEKRLVEYFNQELTEFLITYENTAEILLQKLEQAHDYDNSKKFHFPKNLNLSLKEQMISNYLDREQPNLNYVRLIENSKDSKELRLSAKTKLKAKKKSSELNNRILEDGYTWQNGVHVVLSKDQIEPVKSDYVDQTLKMSYSQKFLDDFYDEKDFVYAFKFPFAFTNQKCLITLVSKASELDVLERMFVKSKNEYITGARFLSKENLSNIQIVIAIHYLESRGIEIEAIINSFVGHLNELIAPEQIIFNLESKSSNYLEKIRNLAPEFERLLKQFKVYVEEGKVDLELVQIDTKHIRFGEIPSLVPSKYVYSESNLIHNLKHWFFSDQSTLFYVESFENKYNCLYDLLDKENVPLDNFANYQRGHIDNLINEGYLSVDSNNHVKLNEPVLLSLIKDLHRDEVIDYWSYNETDRAEIDELVAKQLFNTESTLFSRNEKQYFNYYLNQSEFTNGYDIRNKYVHGTNSLSEEEHRSDYIRFLKIVILTLLKIEDDIQLKQDF